VVEATQVPISPALRATFPDQALQLACTGGEDYQLLMVAPTAVLERVRARASVPLTLIGHMVEGKEKRPRLLDVKGRELNFPRKGWDHLAKGSS